jgi:hypothetical protein
MVPLTLGANFNLNVNKYFPLSDKKMIGNNTEDPLAGYDVKFSGQVPYLPWAKVKATRYIWDGVAQPNVKGTIFGLQMCGLLLWLRVLR